MDNEKDLNANFHKIGTDDAEFTMHIRKTKNPAELLEKFYRLRHNTTLSTEEKNEEVRKIMIDYMG